MEKVLISAVFVFASMGLTTAAVGSECYGLKIGSQNRMFVVDDGGRAKPLTSLGGDRFKISANLLGEDRTIKFVGTGFARDEDFPVVVKVMAKAKSGSTTDGIWLHRPAMIGHREFAKTKYSLKKYNRHHYAENGSSVSELRKRFHMGYKLRNDNKEQRTDGDASKRTKFVFPEAPNEYKSLTAKLLTPFTSPASAGPTKASYLQAEIRNLRDNDCFEFKSSLPEDTISVRIEVVPIDKRQSKPKFRSIWRIEEK